MEMPTTSDADAKKGAGGFFFIIVQIILMACDRGSYILIDWWLATWTSSVGNSITVLGVIFPDQFDSQDPYLIVYSVLVLCMLIFLAARSQWAVFGGIRYSSLYRHAPMWYFDTNPIGRILNRFKYDVEQVDIILSQFSELSYHALLSS